MNKEHEKPTVHCGGGSGQSWVKHGKNKPETKTIATTDTKEGYLENQGPLEGKRE